MKKMNGKKLNNKGFTLIELLAVVVILAVVMGIAMTSVLSAMNKSRGGSLQDSAMVVANGFLQSYTESLVDGAASNVYGKYNFTSTGNYELDESLAETFNISKDTYLLGTASTTSIGSATKSFVTFNVTTGKFNVCLFAKSTGSYYVDSYKSKSAIAVDGVSIAAGSMYACSNGINSWSGEAAQESTQEESTQEETNQEETN